MYHAIVVLESLANERILKDFQIVKEKAEDNLHLSILAIENPDELVEKLQKAMMSNKPYYFHIYDNGISMRIVFKDAIFRVNPNNKNTWIAAQKFGRSINIPEKQLDFYPTRIKEEENWLK